MNRAIATRLGRVPTGGDATAEAFVERQYRELFERPADWEGRVHWTAALHQGASAEDLVAWLKGSPEYRARQGG